MSLSPFRSPISVILAIAVLDQQSQSLADGVCNMCDERGGSTPKPHKLLIFLDEITKGINGSTLNLGCGAESKAGGDMLVLKKVAVKVY